MPRSPAAWLLTAARRRLVDRLRTEAVAARALPALVVEASVQDGARRVMADAVERVVDERLRLVLLCAHPSLPREHAAALTLRLVLGVSTADIARLFLVSTPTMAARLTRARHTLAGERFAVPEGAALRNRVAVVADVAYLAFTAGYAPGSGADVVRTDVGGEAIRLLRVLRDVLPDEVDGAVVDDLDALLALMLLQHSRRDARARLGPDDEVATLVLLPDQDRSRWHHGEIAEALGLLASLVRDAAGAPSVYLLDALIAAEHASAPTAGDTDWPRLAGWYAELETLTGSPVVRLNRAVAVAETEGPDAALRLLEGCELPGHRLPATRAELHARAGRTGPARALYDEAVAACAHDVEREHLRRRRAHLDHGSVSDADAEGMPEP